jgi:putative ABC transport system permease protein
MSVGELWPRLVSLYRNLLHRTRADADLDDEIRSARDLLADEKLAAGLSPTDAHRSAVLALGGVEQIKERVRDVRAGALVEVLLSDVRYAVRAFWRSPGFSAVSVLTLALGIGANTAIFSVVNAVVLRPLPFREPGRLLVFITSRSETTGSVTSVSVPDFEDWQRQASSFESLGLSSGWTFNLTGRDLPERIYGARVNGSLFPALGAAPLLGRTIDPDDDRAERDEVAVLSYSLWQRLFGGDAGIIGQPLMMEGRPHYVIGVMPPGFHFPSTDTELWSAMKDVMAGMPRDGRFLAAAGRLKPGASVAGAQAELDTINAALGEAYPQSNRGWRTRVVPAREALVTDIRPAMLLLLGAVGLVLLIACANLSNLLLARDAARTRETAVRIALGATRPRIVTQMLAENLLVALVGGGLGVSVAVAATRLLASFGPADIPRLAEARVDATVLTVMFAISVLAGIAPALAPALQAARVDLQPSLKEGQGAVIRLASAQRAGDMLIVTEVALAVTLAIAGGLLLRTFARVTLTPPGFDARGVLSLKVFLTPPRYTTIESGKAYIGRALERVARVPGVESVAAVSQLPLGDPSSTLTFELEGHTVSPDDTASTAYRAVSWSYFHVMRIPLLRGRALDESDDESSTFVVLINDSMARRYFQDRDPIGRRIRWTRPGEDHRWLTIVGVVADVKSLGLDRGEGPAVYAHYPQRLFTWLRWNTFVVRAHGDPSQYAMPIRRAMAEIDPDQPVYQVQPLEHVLAQSTAARRFNTLLLNLFSALALLLAGVGVYGTIGYWVAQRTREIGVRMALGATPSTIAAMVVARSGRLTVIGVAIGIVLAAAAARVLASLLYGVSPTDPVTFLAVAVFVGLLGMAAAYLPARRASRLDPLEVIR